MDSWNRVSRDYQRIGIAVGGVIGAPVIYRHVVSWMKRRENEALGKAYYGKCKQRLQDLESRVNKEKVLATYCTSYNNSMGKSFLTLY